MISLTPFQNLAHFSECINELKLLKRRIFLTDQQTLEDDAQHSFDVALTSLYLYHTRPAPMSHLNLEKILIIALVHDFVELWAGDLDASTATPEEREQAKKREQEAIPTIRKRFPEFPVLAQYVEAYEAQDCEEATFVRAVDSLVPYLMEFQSGYSSSRFKKLSREKMLELRQTLLKHPVTARYADEFTPSLNIYFPCPPSNPQPRSQDTPV